MNWCDSNARASKKNKPTGHRSLLPHREQIGGLFSLLRCLCCFCFVCVPFLDGIGNSFLVIFRVCLRYKKAKEASENGNYQKLVCSDSHRPPRASQRRTGTVGPDHQRVHRQPHPRLFRWNVQAKSAFAGIRLLRDDFFFPRKRAAPAQYCNYHTVCKQSPAQRGESQRRRGRRWRKHRANVHLHSLPRIPRSPMPPAGGKTCGYTPQEGEKCE